MKVVDLNIDELTINIREAKGKKDRISILPEKLIDYLRNIIAGKDAGEYVFDSIRGGKLTTTSFPKMFRKSLSKTDVKKRPLFIRFATLLRPIYLKTELMLDMFKNC